MCVCICIYFCTHIYIYIYTHIHVHIHMHTHVYIYMCTSIYTLYIYIYIYTYIQIYIYTYIHIYIYICIHIYIYIYIHVYVCSGYRDMPGQPGNLNRKVMNPKPRQYVRPCNGSRRHKAHTHTHSERHTKRNHLGTMTNDIGITKYQSHAESTVSIDSGTCIPLRMLISDLA